MAEPILSAFEEALRRIVREEMTAVLEEYARAELTRERRAAEYAASTSAEPAPEPEGRPLGTKDMVWYDVDSFALKSGSKTYTVAKGNPVKVKGWGRSGGNADGYTVTRIQRRGDDINVEVQKGRDNPRTVKADKIVYKRPKKGTS